MRSASSSPQILGGRRRQPTFGLRPVSPECVKHCGLVQEAWLRRYGYHRAAGIREEDCLAHLAIPATNGKAETTIRAKLELRIAHVVHDLVEIEGLFIARRGADHTDRHPGVHVERRHETMCVRFKAILHLLATELHAVGIPTCGDQAG